MLGVSPVKKFIDVLNICYKTLVDEGEYKSINPFHMQKTLTL